MSYIRDMIFKEDLHIAKPRIRRGFIAILASTLLFAAWHYGIISSAALGLRTFAIAIWDMMCSLADACGDFLQFIRGQRSQ
jgi:hypothetical protein